MEKGRKMNKGIVICGFEGTKTKYNIFPKTFNGLDLVNERIYPHYNKISTEQRIKTEKYDCLVLSYDTKSRIRKKKEKFWNQIKTVLISKKAMTFLASTFFLIPLIFQNIRMQHFFIIINIS